MKSLLTLLAASAIALSATTGFAADKCKDCGKCCKGEGKATCTHDCCKDKK